MVDFKIMSELENMNDGSFCFKPYDAYVPGSGGLISGFSPGYEQFFTPSLSDVMSDSCLSGSANRRLLGSWRTAESAPSAECVSRCAKFFYNCFTGATDC